MANNPIKNLAGQTVVYGMGTIVPRLLNYMLVPLYTRIFQDQGVYGQITELYAYIAFLMVLLTYGMETAFFRYAQKTDALKVFNAAFTPILITTGIFLSLVFFFYQPIASAIQYEGTPEYIIFIALIVALDAVTALPFAYLRKLNKARFFASIKLANVALNVGLNMLLFVGFPELTKNITTQLFGPETNLVVWVFIINLISSLLSLLLLESVIKTFRWTLNKEILQPMLKYAFPVLIVGLAGMVNEVFDKILLKYLVPEDAGPMAQLGIYGANYKLGILMTLFIQMFRYAAEPFFFAEAEKKNAPELFAKVMNYFVIAGLLIFLIVSLYIDLFKYFIGEKYRVGLVIVPIILMANLFYGIYFNLSVWYKLTDRTADGAKISIGGAIITIVLNIILIPILGYVGAAWATFFCFFAMMLASYIWGQKVYPIPYQLKRLLLYFLIALVIFFSVRYIAEYHRILSYFASTILLALFAFFAFSREKTNTIDN